jgi:hypothetical protein
MQSVYSWMGTPIQLLLEEEVAEGYNRFLNAFFEAQREHKVRTGSDWTGVEPLYIECEEKDQEIYNAVGEIINQLIKLNGGSLNISEEQCTSDFFVKV